MRLKDKLVQALVDEGGGGELRAAVVSAMPDGLVVWSWVDGDRVIATHEFAALGRAASACLSGLDVEASAMTLALRVDNLQVLSWPLGHEGRLVVHFVYDGDLLAGLARSHSKQARDRLLLAIDDAGLLGPDPIRDSLVDLLLLDTPELALLGLRDQGALTLAELEWPEWLVDSRRAELSAATDLALGERLLQGARCPS